MNENLVQDSTIDQRTDHLGNQYSSITEMCRAYHIQADTFMHRMKRGWSLEKSLTKPVRSRVVYHQPKTSTSNEKKYIDPEGNTFNSVAKMCSYWGIGVSAFRYRIQQGLPLKLALTAHPVTHKKCHTDHLGQQFNTISDMCNYWNIKTTTYLSRISYGWSVKDALTLQTYHKKIRPQTEDNYFTYLVVYLGQTYLVYAKNSEEASQRWHIYKGYMSQQPGVSVLQLEPGTKLPDSCIVI